MQRHVFLIPGFFGFANLGDFTYWGPVRDRLEEIFAETGVTTRIYSVKSLPTASLRQRTRVLLDTVAEARPGPRDRVHLVGHSTGGLDARLLLTPAVDLETRRDVEKLVAKVRSSISVATPHYGAPIASVFTGLMGRSLLRLLSLATMSALRNGQMPLSLWAKIAGLYAMPQSFDLARETLVSQVYRQLLADFNAQRRTEVEELLGEVQRDQSLLTQLTVESMDLFNAAAGDRESVAYGSIVTRARPASLASSLEIGLDPVDQAQLALYFSLTRLAAGYQFPDPAPAQRRAIRKALGEMPDDSANDGIVPTLSQPWGECIAVAQADHLDIIGHHGSAPDDRHDHYDWLKTLSGFREQEFDRVWRAAARFILDAER